MHRATLWETFEGSQFYEPESKYIGLGYIPVIPAMYDRILPISRWYVAAAAEDMK